MAGPDDIIEDDESDAAYDEAFDAHRTALYEQLLAYADEHDLSDGFIADLVADLSLSLRMVAYASETEKPSVGGLRLDLDRYARELGEAVREAKKHGADFISEAKAAREREEAEGEEQDGEDQEGEGGGRPQ